MLAHRCFDFRYLKNAAVAGLGFHPFDHVDHSAQGRLAKAGEEPCLAEHRLFHQGIARAYGDAVTT